MEKENENTSKVDNKDEISNNENNSENDQKEELKIEDKLTYYWFIGALIYLHFCYEMFPQANIIYILMSVMMQRIWWKDFLDR